MKRAIPLQESRTEKQLRRHYEVERELADRLRRADTRTRLELYRSVYDELFQRVPDHPQLTRRDDPEEHAWAIERQSRLLAPLLEPTSTFLEVGAGACALAKAVAALVEKVYAVDVSEEITRGLQLPSNVEVVISDGRDIPVPDQAVDVAYSNNLMEHLHPDDAIAQLREIRRSLRPNGVYICLTPNRIGGPHDISRYFSDVATGFHLKEYTVGELHRLFLEAGFARTFLYVGGQGRYFKSPKFPATALEFLLSRLFRRFTMRAVQNRLVSGILGIRLVGVR